MTKSFLVRHYIVISKVLSNKQRRFFVPLRHAKKLCTFCCLQINFFCIFPLFKNILIKDTVTATTCANYTRPVLPGYADFSEGRKLSTRKKTSKHRRDELRKLISHEIPNVHLFHSGERYNATAASIRASLIYLIQFNFF